MGTRTTVSTTLTCSSSSTTHLRIQESDGLAEGTEDALMIVTLGSDARGPIGAVDVITPAASGPGELTVSGRAYNIQSMNERIMRYIMNINKYHF